MNAFHYVLLFTEGLRDLMKMKVFEARFCLHEVKHARKPLTLSPPYICHLIYGTRVCLFIYLLLLN